MTGLFTIKQEHPLEIAVGASVQAVGLKEVAAERFSIIVSGESVKWSTVVVTVRVVLAMIRGRTLVIREGCKEDF
jgi:hypothetical protein